MFSSTRMTMELSAMGYLIPLQEFEYVYQIGPILYNRNEYYSLFQGHLLPFFGLEFLTM